MPQVRLLQSKIAMGPLYEGSVGPAQQLQIHFVKKEEAAVFSVAATVRPHALRGSYAALQGALQIHLATRAVADCSKRQHVKWH